MHNIECDRYVILTCEASTFSWFSNNTHGHSAVYTSMCYEIMLYAVSVYPDVWRHLFGIIVNNMLLYYM